MLVICTCNYPSPPPIACTVGVGRTTSKPEAELLSHATAVRNVEEAALPLSRQSTRTKANRKHHALQSQEDVTEVTPSNSHSLGISALPQPLRGYQQRCQVISNGRRHWGDGTCPTQGMVVREIRSRNWWGGAPATDSAVRSAARCTQPLSQRR